MSIAGPSPLPSSRREILVSRIMARASVSFNGGKSSATSR